MSKKILVSLTTNDNKAYEITGRDIGGGKVALDVYDNNSAGGGGVTQVVDSGIILNTYAFHDLDEAAAGITYIGYKDGNGAWLIKKMDESATPDIQMLYANESNNVTHATYTSAWTNRATLTYNEIDALTFDSVSTAGVTNYSVSATISSLANGASAYLLGVTSTTTVTFTDFELTSDNGNILIQLYEAGTVSANGTPITSYDMDRQGATTATMTTFVNPTVTGDGTLLSTHEIPSTDKKTGGGGEHTGENWRFKLSTNYFLKITNNSGSVANLRGNFYWSEG